MEGPAENGSLGPALHIHKGGSTAFSYSRDLRLHLHALYFISEQLCTSIGGIAEFDETAREIRVSDDKRFVELAGQISELPLIVFPDELDFDFPTILIEETAPREYQLVASLKRRPRGLKTIPRPFQVVTFYQTDGVTSAYRMPYSK